MANPWSTRLPQAASSSHVTIIVYNNAANKAFKVSKRLLTSSLYFSTKYNEVANGKNPQRIRFFCPDLVWFQIYVVWLETRRYKPRWEIEGWNESAAVETAVKARTHYRDLLACWVLGVDAKDQRFRDAMMSKLRRDTHSREMARYRSQFTKCLDHVLIKAIFDNSADSEPIRKLVLETIVVFGDAEDIEAFGPKQPPAYHHEFIRSLLRMLAGSRADPDRNPYLDELPPSPFLPGSGALDHPMPRTHPNQQRRYSDCGWHEHGVDRPCWRDAK